MKRRFVLCVLHVALLAVLAVPAAWARAADDAPALPSGEARSARSTSTKAAPSGAHANGNDTARPLSIEDVVGMESMRDADVSRAGDAVVWVRRRVDLDADRTTGHVMLTRIDEGETVQLTRGRHRDRSPRFSPDGRRVAFIGTRAKKQEPQVWLLDLRGGEPERVTSWSTGVRAFAWLDDSTLVFSAREDSTYRERELRRTHDDAEVVADAEHYPPVRLFARNLRTHHTRRLTHNTGQITEFAVSPDGRRIVLAINRDVNYGYNNEVPPAQYLYDVARGALVEICRAPHVDPYDFAWASDGSGFWCRRDVASDTTDTFVALSMLHWFDLRDSTLTRVPVRQDRGLGGAFVVVRDGLLAALADGVTDRIVHLSGAPLRPRVRRVPSARTLRLLAAQPGGDRIVYAAATAATIPDVMTARIDGARLRGERPLVTLNERLRHRRLARREIVRWAGARGDTVEGILYYPVDWDSSRAWPLVAWIHGGPSSRNMDFFSERWSAYPHLLAGRGAFVLTVNYHGSSGYGLEWLESIRGHYYELEVPDILRGVDAQVARGLAHPDSLGIMGWSNGSILSIACCIESDRFKVLCAGAGDVNWTSDYGNCAFGAGFDEAYFGGTPWANTQAYIDKSPLFRMEKVTTPTIIFFGEKDTSVPTEQGWQHFRALERIGKVPVRFVLFPGTGHGLSRPAHQRRKMREELAWIDRYLFGRPLPDDPLYGPDTPLARALALAKAARVGALYGREVDASLVPETVPAGEVEVSRFEVTNAQFAAFDPNFTYPPGADNLPVTNVSYPLAQTYCMWLSRRTGHTWRLPTRAEMDAWMARAKGHRGNTLERWVGRTPTPDELERLREVIAKLEETRSLLEPVGRFAPVDGIYDLDGNAAEWVTGPDGEGEIVGACAVTLSDADGSERPPLSYVGFRVVRERR